MRIPPARFAVWIELNLDSVVRGRADNRCTRVDGVTVAALVVHHRRCVRGNVGDHVRGEKYLDGASRQFYGALNVEPGSALAFVVGNGAGKTTTTMKLMVNL